MTHLEQPSPRLLEELARLHARLTEREASEVGYRQAEQALEEQRQLATLLKVVSDAFIRQGTLHDQLQECTHALVQGLDDAIARIWTLSTDTQTFELQASADLYSQLDESQSHVPVGSFEIGTLTVQQLPYVTNTLVGNPLIRNQDWAKREGMMAFAGYPLTVEGRLVGVLALFSRTPLHSPILQALTSVASIIALGIDRKQKEQEHHRLLLRNQQARTQTEEALQKHTMFLSSLVHDLKTPLTVIGGSVEVLRSCLPQVPAPYAAQFTKGIALIETAQAEVMTMIEDALDLAHLQTGQPLSLVAQDLDLVHLTRHVASEQQHMTTSHRIVVETDAPQLIIRGDAARLKRVLTNLISNAVKYSPKGGEILVKVIREEGAHPRATLEIQDQGVGLPTAELQAIFKPFYRATNVVGRVQGTGIGLASASYLIEQHGGTISASSEEGKGTTFIVSLPLLN